MDARIITVRSRILQSLRHEWSVGEMAEIAGLSAPHFQKLFKHAIGKPPMTFVHDLRLEKARELLETTFLRVKEIGVRTGLTNGSHFTRDFQKKFGQTPSGYRRQYHEQIKSELQP